MADNRKKLRYEIEAVVDGAQRVRSLAGDMNRLSDTARQPMRDPTGRLRAGVQRTAQAVLSLQSALAGLAIGFVMRDIAQAGLEMERLKRGLESVAGSAEAARREFEFVRDTANRLGLDLRQTAKEYTQLAAAAKGTALEGQATRDILEGVGNAALALGLNAEQTGGALNALQQIISKGRVSAEELRQQLGERLPGAFRIAAESIGVTTDQLNKMLEQGELTAEELLPKLADELKNRYGPAAKEAGDSAQAAFARFQNVLFELKEQLAEELLPPLVESSRVLREEMTNKDTIEGLRSLVKLMGDLALFGAQVGAVMGDAAEAVRNFSKDVAAAQTGKFEASLRQINNRIATLRAAIQREEEGGLYKWIAGGVEDLEAAKQRLAELESLRQRIIDRQNQDSGGSSDQGSGDSGSSQSDSSSNFSDSDSFTDGSGSSGGNEGPRTVRAPYRFQGVRAAVPSQLSEAEKALRKVREEMEKTSDQANDTEQQMSEFAKSAARNIQSAFADYLFDPIDNSFEGMVKKFGETLRRMYAEALAAKILGTGKGDESWVGKFFTQMLTSNTGTTSTSTSGSSFTGVRANVRHGGGMAAGGGSTRNVSAAAFAGAPRFHRGGIPSLQSGEVPIIARSDEEILTRNDARHRANGGGVMPKVSVVFNNQGTPQEQVGEAEMEMDADGMVVRVVTDDVRRDGEISQAFQSAFGLRRGGGR
jgi:tape measure domain-containing protein